MELIPFRRKADSLSGRSPVRFNRIDSIFRIKASQSFNFLRIPEPLIRLSPMYVSQMDVRPSGRSLYSGESIIYPRPKYRSNRLTRSNDYSGKSNNEAAFASGLNWNLPFSDTQLRHRVERVRGEIFAINRDYFCSITTEIWLVPIQDQRPSAHNRRHFQDELRRANVCHNK